jgi:predicted MPP superfamily phosphohydrolase
VNTVLVVGDLHFPFHCPETLKAIYAAAKKIKPSVIVQIGDVYDFFAQSRFPKRPGAITVDQELDEGFAAAVAFWRNLKEAAPKAACHQLLGNHCIRPLKISAEKAPELYPFVKKGWEEMFKFRGVHTLFDTRDDLEIDGVIYEHGFYGQPGKHMRENMKPTVIGHTHRP